MGAKYQPIFESRLKALNPDIQRNRLTAAQFTGVLATDVLNVKTSEKQLFDGTNVLTGRV
jgi:hypothetical protein